MLWRNRARMKAVGFHPKRRGASGHGTLFILFLILLLNSTLGNILKDERNRSLVPLLRLSSACQAELNAQRECKTIERDARRRIGGSVSNVKTRKGRMSRGEAPLQSMGGIFEKNNKKGPIFEVGRERHDKLFETIFQLHRQRPKEQQQETSGGGTKRRQIASRTDGARLSVPHPKGNPTPKLRVFYPHQKINK
ncbi:Uncharacterized protein APZ42_027411 [Daphnia magna]|uniref:Uncharacterized protein n=1 Tax=Daphnia magna TaxID=35525 RepID=A0A164RIQ6_9CRUS|nr:Uncharacterized protein APZ42_027411 [Daphnia magna]